MANAVGRHVALVGFMGAGKSTLGPRLAERLGRPFVSVDAVVEARAGVTVAELFERDGEPAFRALEEDTAVDVLSRRPPGVIELGGGSLGSARSRAALAEHALVVYLEATVDEAWERVAESGRPLARDAEAFRVLYEERLPSYEAVADGTARDVDGTVLAAAGVRFGSHADARGSALMADSNVARLHGITATHLVGGKSLVEAERLWGELALDRSSTLVALGGGSTTDVVGFVAATYMRGIDWVAVPSTLVGQVDAAIGGKVAVDLPEGKNLVGAFHWPVETIVDTSLLATLPPDELRNGLAEVVKTGLLSGERLWELDTAEQVHKCAAFKAAVCLRDPFEQGERTQLNLGHTFAHALEAASGYSVDHGHAVALGLVAALKLSELGEQARLVEEVLEPAKVSVDVDVAWAALQRDKKSRDGRLTLVLLDAPGKPRVTSELDPAAVRAILETLIA